MRLLARCALAADAQRRLGAARHRHGLRAAGAGPPCPSPTSGRGTSGMATTGTSSRSRIERAPYTSTWRVSR